MALPSTIYKVRLSVADMDRQHYADYALTLARHPSETEQRLMVRLLAFALNADERLEFTRGLCADDEPELWVRDFSNEVELWIEVGLPDERRLRKACGRAGTVVLYSYGGHAAHLWWQKNGPTLQRYSNLVVVDIPEEGSRSLTAMAARSMELQVTIQEGHVWFDDGRQTVEINPQGIYRA